MRSLRSLVWRNLTAHRLRSVLTALAVALGVGMVLAAAIVGQAASQSASEIAGEGPRVDLEVQAHDGGVFGPAVLETLRTSPLVDQVSSSLRVETEAIQPAIPRLVLKGVDPEAYSAFHEPKLADGVFLDGPETVVLPMGVALRHGLRSGDEIVLCTPVRTISLTVSGRLKAEAGIEALAAGSDAAFVPLEVAQSLTISERIQGPIDHVEVSLHPGTRLEQARRTLARALGPDLVVARAVGTEGVMGNVVLVQAGLAVVGLIILFAAGFVILNAFAMSVTGRMRELGTLRALGMTRRQVVGMVLAEAGLVGSVGIAVGILAGLGLAWAVMRAMGTLEDVPLQVPLWGLALGVLMGLGVILVGALQPAWRAGYVSPVVAARPEVTLATGWYVRSGSRIGAVLLAFVLLGMAAYGLLGRPSVWAAQAVMMLGQGAMLGATILLLPGLVEPVAALCRSLLARWQGAGWQVASRLAADNLGRNKLRTALTAGALATGLTIIVATSGLMTASLKGSITRILSSMHEDGFVTADLGELVASQEMTVDNFFQFIAPEDLWFDLSPVVEALAPHVEAGQIEMVRYRFQSIPSELSAIPGAPGLFVDPEPFLGIGNFCFFEGDPETALKWMKRGRAVLLMPIAAERLGVQVGDEIPIQTPQGEVSFTVAGIGGSGMMMAVFPYADGEAYFNATTPSFLGIAVGEERDAETALAQVREAIQPFSQITLLDYRRSLDPVVDMIAQLELLLDGLLLLAVVVAALGVVNSMVINVAERQREIGLLRAVGATQRQVRRTIVAEAAMMGLLAALVAGGLGLLMLLSWGVLVLPYGTTSVGVRPDWDTIRLTMGGGLRAWGLAGAISMVLGPVVAGLAAYFPARQAAALDVVEATRSEQVTLGRARPSRPESCRSVGRMHPLGLRCQVGSLFVLVWRNLTSHKLRSVLTALAITLGVGMVLAAAIVGQAASQSVREVASDGPRAGLEIVARDGDRFEQAVLGRIVNSPDVEVVLPSLHVEVEGLDPGIPHLKLLGVEPSAYQALHRPELANGVFLDESDTLVLPMMVAMDNGLNVGDKVKLRTVHPEEQTGSEQVIVLTVAGRLRLESEGVPPDRSLPAIVPLDTAQRLLGEPGQIDRIELSLHSGADVDQVKVDLSSLLPPELAVVRVEARGGVGFNTALIQGGLAIVGLMILFAAGFVILNAFAMSVTQRTQEMGALRALGMTRRQIMGVVLLEAGLLGLIGAGAGVLVGLGLAWGVMVARGLLDEVAFAVPWWGVVISPLLGLAVTLVGAFQPAWRASRLSPIAAMRPEVSPASGWYVRFGGRAGAVILLILLPALAIYGLVGRPDIWKAMLAFGLGIMGLLVAMVLLLPALLAPAAALCRPILVSRLGTVGRLAADNLGRNRLRSALTAGALVAGLTMIVASSGLLTLFLEGSIGLIGAVMNEDMVVTADFVEKMTAGEITLENIYQSMADLSLDPAVADALAPLEEAGTIELQRVGIAAVPPELTTVPTGQESAGMFVDLEPFIRIGNFDFYEGDPERALQWIGRGRAVLLQPLAAERLGVGVGDTLLVETARGDVEFTVAGIGGSGLFSPIFAYGDGEEYFDLGGLFQLGIIVSEGQDVDAVLAQVQEALRPYPGVMVMKDVGSIIDEAAGMFDRFRTLLSALLLLAVVVAGLGVINTMVISVAERGREIGLLRAVGATQRQVRQTIVAEAATLGLVAALTAIVLSLLMLLAYVLVVMPNGWGALGMRSDGATMASSLLAALGDMGVAAILSLLAGPLVAGLAAYVPARQAAAMDVVEATRSEQVVLKRAIPSRPERSRESMLLRPQRPRRRAGGLNILVWRNLAAHRLRSVLTALAITLGVGMVLAAAIVGQAASQSASEIAGEGPRGDLEILARDGGRFEQRMVYDLGASPDVELLSPSLSVEMEGVEPRMLRLVLLGVEPEAYQALHRPELANGEFPGELDTIVLPMAVAIEHDLNVGDQITLRVAESAGEAGDGQTRTLTVAGRLKLETGGIPLGQPSSALVTLETAQAILGAPGQITRVELALSPQADVERVRTECSARLDASLTVVQVATGSGPGVAFALVQLGLVMVGAIILFAAAFVIFNAFAMSVTGRLQEIGALRALGMTRRQIMGQVWVEAGLLGLAGATLGLGMGITLAWAVLRAMNMLDDVSFIVPWWGVVLSLLLGLGVTLLGALQPAWRASRISPLEAVRSQSAKGDGGWYVRYGGRVGGLLLLILMPALVVLALVLRPDFLQSFVLVGVGQIGLLLGTVLLLPALVGPAVFVFRPLLTRWLGTPGRLAADNMERNKLRAVLTAGALTAALTVIIATSGMMTALLRGGLKGYFTFFNEDGMVMPDIPALLATGELSIDNSYERLTTGAVLDPAIVQAVEAAAEANAITLERIGFAPIPPELAPIAGAPGVFVEPEIFLGLGNFDFFEGDPESALQLMQRGPAILLFPITAEKLGVGVGDTIPVQTPHGEVEFMVAGIGGNGYNFTTFSYADGEQYFDLAGPSWLGLLVAEGRDARDAVRQVHQALQPFEGVMAGSLDSEALENSFFRVVGRFQMLLNALLLLAVVVAALGVVNTMVINVAERRREIALLRAVGATQRQVRQAVMGEAAVLGLMAVLAATALSLGILLLFSGVMTPGGTESMGFRVSWELAALSLPPALRDLGIAAALSLLLGPAIAALAAYYPARQAAAMDVVEATRSEQVALKSAGVRRPERHRMARSLAWALAWRNLGQNRLRSALSALAVALGVAMTVAADLTSNSILNSLSQSKDALTFMTGLLDQLDRMLILVGVMIAVAAGFLVFNAFAMSVTQRRRQIGALRSLGMTRRQVMRLVLTEATIIGGLGTCLGLVVGPLMGRGTIALMRAALGDGIFLFGASTASPATLPLAAGLGMGITLLSALIPARRAACVSPLVALREGEGLGTTPSYARRALAGGLVVVSLFAYLAIAPPGEWVQSPWDANLVVLFVALWLGSLAWMLPALIGSVGRWLRRSLARLLGVTGRLVADNVQRGRGRVTLTIVTLAVALTMIVSLTGIMHFMMHELMWSKMQFSGAEGALGLAPFDIMEGMSAYSGMESITIPPEALAQVRQVAAGRARVIEFHFVVVPELSFFGDSYFSFLVDPGELRGSGAFAFRFTEGGWETALPIMESGCSVLVMPLVANKNDVAVGDILQVTGANGPVECTVAGIGESFVGASILSSKSDTAFDVTETSLMAILPLPGEDEGALENDLKAVTERFPNAVLMEIENLTRLQLEVMDVLPNVFNALLLLAIVAAALGVVNTTVMSVVERRRELGLLRAVGATRRQVIAVVTGEAALMGLIGGGLGWIAGMGVTIILVVTYGGNSWGLSGLDLWPAAWRSSQPALLTGLIGLLAAPLICAGAAWLPARATLRGSAVETLQPEQQPTVAARRAVRGLLGWGSIRTRFVLGTAALLAVVLVGLIAAVTAHERRYLEDVIQDTLLAFVEGQGSMIELNLPDDTQRLSPSDLQMDQLDADALLRFRALMDDMTVYGLESFTVADVDNVALLTLDPRETGTVLPALESPAEAVVTSEREAGSWQMHAAAPIWNGEGDLLGSVRMTVNMATVQDFVAQTRNTLLLVGGLIVAIGLLLSWVLATPLVAVASQLAARAARVAHGEYIPIDRRRRKWSGFVARTSLRMRLTAVLVLVVVLLVGTLQLFAIPIERHHTESKLKDGMISATAWMGQLVSEGMASELLAGDSFSLDQLLEMAGTIDWAELQELSEKTRSEDLAFVALVDEDGIIQFSNQLAQIGEIAAVPVETQLEEARWQDEEVWIVSTPLQRGRDGEQVGALRLGVRRATVEAFLDESRTLFRLVGLIAVLAGILLAQAIGGAVTAPVRHLAAGVRRVGQGDLNVQFRTDTRDELSLLATAFNQMVAGLREREWLRDMFGRFVSREVAEAIRTGQVRLEGENRVVSVLFCDIRGFTARAERSTPEEVVALLNEYLPVVVLAAQAHAGTVNKFGGDSTLIIYGAPKRLQESAYQAVLTALEMRVGLVRLNRRLTVRGEEPIRIGVGINTGVALAGAVGPQERQEYTVIGDTVNLASRIEALNKDYPEHDILVSGWTYEALGSRRGEFEFVDLGEIPIRGKADPVRVWAVVGWKTPD